MQTQTRKRKKMLWQFERHRKRWRKPSCIPSHETGDWSKVGNLPVDEPFDLVPSVQSGGSLEYLVLLKIYGGNQWGEIVNDCCM